MPRRNSRFLAAVLAAAALLSACAEEYGDVPDRLPPRVQVSAPVAAADAPFADAAEVASGTAQNAIPAEIVVLDGPDALSTVIAAVALGGAAASGGGGAVGPAAPEPQAAAPSQAETAQSQRETELRGAPSVRGPVTATARPPLPPAESGPAPVSPSWTPPGAGEGNIPRPTATAPAASTPDPFELAGIPVRFEAPSIGVDALVEQVGMTADRAMDTPDGWMNVGWYKEGFYPGEAGNAVIAGHLDSNTGGPAVFWDLDKLLPGDEVHVTYQNGDRYTFLVQGASTYPYDADGPMVAAIFGSSFTPDLNLITCDGAWQHGQATYSHRLVVFTSLEPAKTVRAGAGHVVD